MDETIAARIRRAQELLRTARHAAMATVNKDGSPHNTPYYLMFDDELVHFYWGSHPDSQHSKNIKRSGRGFVVIYDAIQRGGLYVRLENAHGTKDGELEQALRVHNQRRAQEGKDPLPLQDYVEGPQRMYQADAVQFWVNGVERDGSGHIIRDYRHEITPADLHRPL